MFDWVLNMVFSSVDNTADLDQRRKENSKWKRLWHLKFTMPR